MDRTKTLEESLREAACIGDIEVVEELISKGININSKHNINGWTPLHWAAKRGHKDIATTLLINGANTSALTTKGETPLALCSSPEICQLLGGKAANPPESPLPINPYYLKHPPLNGKVDIGSKMILRRNKQDVALTNATQDIMVKSGHQPSSSDLPDELVLKVRVANTGDPDFIEVEMSRTELTYSRLLRVCCEELGVNATQVLRVRKLPDTLVRKDKDVQRFHDFQEVEIVTTAPGKKKLMPGSNGLINVGGNANVNGYQSISLYKNQTILY